MTADWACDDVRTLSQLLVRLARLSNEVCDADRDTSEDFATFREIGLQLVGADLPEAWSDLTQCVLALDEYRNDPGASDGEVTEDAVLDDVDMALWCLLYPTAAPCLICRAQLSWRDEVPGVVHWSPMGACARHDQPVTADPWSWVLAESAA
jgi:hypothetical protein